jgi:hypothetical protein
MCKEMLVIQVNRVVDKKIIIRKMERLPPPPHPPNVT